jgi:Zn-dependent M28 family amino/carboxypeptidase
MRVAMHAFLIVVALIALASAALLALVTQPFVAPVRSEPPHVDPARLLAHVKHLSVDLYPRSFDHDRNLEAAAQYIFDEFKAAGASVSVQEVAVEEGRFKNIIARFGPQSGPLLVIGAHYDSHADTSVEITDPRGYSLDTHTPGADDNASGVAGLLELARLLAREPQSQAIELVAYTLEEPPHFRTAHMGSAWHAHSLSAAKRNVRLMLSLEMIGYFSDEPGSQRYPTPVLDHIYPERGNFIALVGRMADFAQMREAKALMTGATDLPVYSINAPSLIPGVDFSDHQSYWDEGYPALMLTDTAFYRNRHYHRVGDTFEKLDYERMANVVQSVYAVTQRLQQ